MNLAGIWAQNYNPLWDRDPDEGLYPINATWGTALGPPIMWIGGLILTSMLLMGAERIRRRDISDMPVTGCLLFFIAYPLCCFAMAWLLAAVGLAPFH